MSNWRSNPKVIFSIIGGIILIAILAAIFPESSLEDDYKYVELCKEEYGDQWPLTIDCVRVYCLEGLCVVAEKPSTKKVWAVNGVARAQMKANDWNDIDEISIDGKGLDLLVSAAIDLCE